VLFIFTGVHYYKVVVHGHSLPPGEENIGEDTAKRVPLDKRVYFIPDILTSEIMWIGITTLVLVVFVTWFFHAPLESHADPQVTPLGTTAPWYFLWIQGALKLGDKVLWGIVFPTVVVVFLLVMPYLDVTKSRRYADRRFAFSVSFIMLSALVVLSYMGLAEFGVKTSADAEVLHAMVMEPAHNHMGHLRPVPFEELVPGQYATVQFEALPGEEGGVLAAFNEEIQDNGQAAALLTYLQNDAHLHIENINFVPVPADAPELEEALLSFYEDLERNTAELHNAWGGIIITEQQNGLKRADVVIVWDSVQIENGKPVFDANGQPIVVTDENGNPVIRVNGQHMYLHEDSQYFAAPGV
jgi:hypothetical protein